MPNNATLPMQQSKVVMTGKLPTGEDVVQEIAMNHAPGTPDSALMAKALEMIRGAGGLMIEGDKGAINFYPLLGLKLINVAVKRVVLVGLA
ncbi:MAG: hypothetical protein ACYDHE_11190 [Candidatus Acidiferrales bacterium]